MPRKRCCGVIDQLPCRKRFTPDGADQGMRINLFVEELEAVRLKDMVGMDQQECAEEMRVSRSTFQRILLSARAKIARALVEGHPIIIQGGNFMVKNREFECVDCGKVWEEAPCTAGGKHGYEIACPQCGSMKKMKLDNGEKHACGGHHGGGGCGCGGNH